MFEARTELSICNYRVLKLFRGGGEEGGRGGKGGFNKMAILLKSKTNANIQCRFLFCTPKRVLKVDSCRYRTFLHCILSFFFVYIFKSCTKQCPQTFFFLMLMREITESFDKGDLCLFSGDVASSLPTLFRDATHRKQTNDR